MNSRKDKNKRASRAASLSTKIILARHYFSNKLAGVFFKGGYLYILILTSSKKPVPFLATSMLAFENLW
jgi:hypothetical protein